MIKRVQAKELKILFVATLNNAKGFDYGEGNPFFLRIQRQSYHVFLMNISTPTKSKGITRVILTYDKHLKTLPRNGPLLAVLGYDVSNDVFVTWNPLLIQERVKKKEKIV